MMKKTILYNKVLRATRQLSAFVLLAMVPLLGACDHIADGDELIEVSRVAPIEPEEPAEPGDELPTQTLRYVLLEDFTGQRCSNCPAGTKVIDQLVEAYGDRLIPVSIHSGPLGFKGTATVVGLATELGDQYFDYWKLEFQPVGLIDRHGVINYTDWIGAVNGELDRPSTLQMQAALTAQGAELHVTVSIGCLAESYAGKLQVWLIEDGITALQTMPDGTNSRDYVHKHVFRTAVNGLWGTDFTAVRGDQKETTYSVTADSQWNLDNLSVVAFAYNGDGVEQVTRSKIAAGGEQE